MAFRLPQYFSRYPGSALRWLLASLLLLAAVPAPAFDAEISAIQDSSCMGTRSGSDLGCTANEFNVNAVFSASPGTPPFCMVGQPFSFLVDVNMTGGNTSRYDVGFFVGQTGNDTQLNDATKQCSVAAFPTSPAPWIDDDGDSCGDNTSAGTTTVRINEIKVVCAADTATGALSIPYAVSYRANKSFVCNVNNVRPSAQSKCQAGSASVSGVNSVLPGGWVDITKETDPLGNTEDFTFTATAAGNTISAVTGATLTDTDADGGTYTTPGTSATFTLKNGQTARVFLQLGTTDRTLTITESALTGWDPVATSLTCTNVTGAGNPTAVPDLNARSVAVTLNASNYAKKCTIKNTKRAWLTVRKRTIGDVGTFEFTGNNTWATQNVTTTVANTFASGTTQYLPQNTATTITETALSGYYLSALSCTGLGSGGTATPDLSARSIALDATAMKPGVNVICDFTNQRTRTLTVTKALSPLTDPGQFVMNANGTAGTEGGDGATASRVVDVTSTVTASESAFTGTNPLNYTASYSCSTSPLTTGSGTSVNFTMPNSDVTCTFTNTRKSAALTLAKTWVNGISGNTATVTSSGFTNNASSGASVSSGANTTTGSAVTVYAGESGTISESFSVGDGNNYVPSLACTGTSGLSGNTLTVAPADTSIACTMTNTRKSATLQLRKTWVQGIAGNQITADSSGFTNNATVTSVAAGNNTDTGTAVTVYAAETGTLAETWDTGSVANYDVSLSCSGTTGLTGNSLSVTAADHGQTIICIFTNAKKVPILSLLKLSSVVSDPVNGVANAKAIPGALVNYTIQLSNSGTGIVDADSVALKDPMPAQSELFVNDLGAGGSGPVLFSDGTPSSGLTYNFISLADDTDDVEFSDDGGATWDYDPSPDVDGFDDNVTHIRIRPKGTMNATGGGNPSFQVVFRVKLN